LGKKRLSLGRILQQDDVPISVSEKDTEGSDKPEAIEGTKMCLGQGYDVSLRFVRDDN